jgi:hypothetical protein
MLCIGESGIRERRQCRVRSIEKGFVTSTEEDMDRIASRLQPVWAASVPEESRRLKY